MPNFQNNKELVLQFYADLDAANPSGINHVLDKYTVSNYFFRGMHPVYEQHGADAVANEFWIPLRHALNPIQRRQDIFMAGANVVDDTEWVCSMGHLMGLFDAAWLGIAPTRKMAFLRYAEFTRISRGLICETGFFCDILGLMQQAGVSPLTEQTGAMLLTPGPMTHDGLLFDSQDPQDTAKTLALVTRMLHELTGSGMHSPLTELGQTWHDDMIWYGPAGIGATYTIDRYEDQHQGPFQSGLSDLEFHGHVCRFAEGCYAGWFGWPNLTMVPNGGYLGFPPTSHEVSMRVVDIYRRDGEKLAENWVFIDLLYFLKQQGIDLLAIAANQS